MSDEQAATAILTIDLAALVANYRRIIELSAPAECAAVVKANAYGLGMAQAAPALARAGCHTFFVATLDEARELRALLPKATIYVLGGLFEGTAPLFHRHELRPVLNSPAEILEWALYCTGTGTKLPAAIHIDSGMNRLGLSAADIDAVANANELSAFELCLVMSHLACADEPEHPKSKTQRGIFDRLRAKLPRAPASFANSAGILLGREYHYDLVRPGIALYGGNQFAPVVRLEGRIVQVRDVAAGETLGYGATRTLRRPSRIATVAVGYADGFFRALSTKDEESGLSVFVGRHEAPVIGRVSMDLIMIDVTEIPQAEAERGRFVELLGDNVSPQTMAMHARTIDYEVLTSLGKRALRRYIGG